MQVAQKQVQLCQHCVKLNHGFRLLEKHPEA
jgi:hypothetical protein